MPSLTPTEFLKLAMRICGLAKFVLLVIRLRVGDDPANGLDDAIVSTTNIQDTRIMRSNSKSISRAELSSSSRSNAVKIVQQTPLARILLGPRITTCFCGKKSTKLTKH